MRRTDQAHMYDEELEHPNRVVVSSRSRRAALVDNEDGSATFVTGDFTESMRGLEKEVKRAKRTWPFSE